VGHNKWANIQRHEGARLRRQAHAAAPTAEADLAWVRYEGYGPGGAALMVDCLTADRERSRDELRRAFAEHGGMLGAEGAVSYLFNTVGLMVYPPGTDVEALMHAALEAGAEDVIAHEDHSVEVLADPRELDDVCAVLTHGGFAPASAAVTERAASSLPLSGESAIDMLELLGALEQLDAVRDIYYNVEICDEALARA
jgi:transcriptional/translational regulatory protein YebC/TACO1